MPPECAEGRPSAHCKINNNISMKVEYIIKAFPGDEVWIADPKGPYKVKIKKVDVPIRQLSKQVVGGCVMYTYDLPGRRCEYHACNSLICMTEEEAQKKSDIYSREGTKEFLRAYYEGVKENEVKVIKDE